MLSHSQLNDILEILDKQFAFFIATTIGEEGLSDSDKKILRDNKIDYKSAYKEGKDLVTTNFLLGQLSNIIGTGDVNKLSYKDLIKYIKSGQYIPLNQKEKTIIQSIKNQSLADIRASKGRIFQDINNVVNKEFGSVRANQEEFIREKIKEGIEARKSKKAIAQEIARLTGDWKRDFSKSVAYISHTALNEGKAAMIEKRYGSNEAKVWFRVQPNACPSCIKAYLTGDIGSEPKIFTIKELQANGSNIGLKQKDWQPTLSALHIHCRCTVHECIEGTVWDGQNFVFPADYKPKRERPKFEMTFNGKKYLV